MYQFFKVDPSPVKGAEPVLPEKKLSGEEALRLYQMIILMEHGTVPTAVPDEFAGEDTVSIWSSRTAFNYHDESWDELEVLSAEKITEEEYEQGIRQPELNQSTRFTEWLQSKWNDGPRHVAFSEYASAFAAEEAACPYRWQAHPIAFFKALADACEACRIWNGAFCGEIRRWGTYRPAYWESYTVAYVSGLRDLPGYYRFVHAVGNDRE